jgi:hypothetical protein
VPKSPAKDGKRNKQGERIREERRTKASGDPTASDDKRVNKKRSGDDAASETAADAPANDTTQSSDRTRERKRNKDGAPSQDAAAGENGAPDDSQVDSRNGDRRGNRKESGAPDGGGQKEPKDDHGKQAPRDPGRHDSSGSHDQGGQHDRNPDQGGHNGGGHKATANAVDSPVSQPPEEPALTLSPG